MTSYDTLESCHCFASRRGARHISRLYDRHLAADGIKSSQFVLLMALEFNPGVTTAKLTDLMAMERTTLLRALKPLQAEGWVSLKKAESGRSHIYQVTALGKKKIKECIPAWKAAKSELEATLGKEQAVSLRETNLAVSSLSF